MKKFSFCAAFCIALLVKQHAVAANASAVTVTQGTITMPTYEHSGRELQPPLFEHSAVRGIYPFPTFRMPLKSAPVKKTYDAIFLENEYLKLTYVPEFGGRFLEMYDKLRKRNVFYKNDVLKPTTLNPRGDWPQEGIELTGPYDVHSLTMHFDPYWSNVVVKNEDGSVTLQLGETDPIYGMTVRYSATLHPGVASLEISTFCFNPNTSRMPQMLWSNAAFPATQGTRFLYPMTRTVGHNTGVVDDWPLYQGIDFSWYRENRNMLGVFGIDPYDNYGGAYMFDQDYGVFRFGDRRVVQGMKMWTFGHGREAALFEAAYTDKAGPYFEAQSGRHVWDGHYEWVEPHQVERWSEWWTPIAGTSGLSTLTRDVALNLRIQPDEAGSQILVDLSPVSLNPDATLMLRSSTGVLLKERLALTPGETVHRKINSTIPPAALRDVTVVMEDSSGKQILEYRYPNPGEKRSEYSAFTKDLEKPSKPVEKMSAEELVLVAESKLKDLDDPSALRLLDQALQKDSGYSLAHSVKGIALYKEGHLQEAQGELQAAVDRDPYADRAWYYLAVTQLGLGKTSEAERNLYYIWPGSAFYGAREYQLGRIDILRAKYQSAVAHLQTSIGRNSEDLSAHHLLVICYRKLGQTQLALQEIATLLRIDPSNREALAEQMFLSNDQAALAEFKRLLGDQSQEALHVAALYSDLSQWKEAAQILQLEAGKNSDPWGTSAVFYYTLASDLKHSGDNAAASDALKQASATSKIMDRFPYLPSSEIPLREAIAANPDDTLARYDLGCLLYSLGRRHEALVEWETAEKSDASNFSVQRAIGLAYADLDQTNKATLHLEKAVALNKSHLGTLNDLLTLYAQAGRFEEELQLLKGAMKNADDTDDLYLRLLDVDLVQGRYADAETIVKTHTFSLRHRDSSLRDLYRALRYAEGSRAFSSGRYAEALTFFQSAQAPPANLGVDDFEAEPSPRLEYYLGRTLDALNKRDEARKAYERSVASADLRSGDRGSFNSDTFFMLLSLKRLGRETEATLTAQSFEKFAASQLTLTETHRRTEGQYLLGLLASLQGDSAEAAVHMQAALKNEPDFLMPRFDLRGDSLGSSVVQQR